MITDQQIDKIAKSTNLEIHETSTLFISKSKYSQIQSLMKIKSNFGSLDRNGAKGKRNFLFQTA